MCVLKFITPTCSLVRHPTALLIHENIQLLKVCSILNFELCSHQQLALALFQQIPRLSLSTCFQVLGYRPSKPPHLRHQNWYGRLVAFADQSKFIQAPSCRWATTQPVLYGEPLRASCSFGSQGHPMCICSNSRLSLKQSSMHPPMNMFACSCSQSAPGYCRVALAKTLAPVAMSVAPLAVKNTT